ncbi:MAG: YCF48-related protein, partial [Candidatus Berkelbacteria bacterium]|nr:YCF48-related protein [Candidatus Berkelbacteria bacterium]
QESETTYSLFSIAAIDTNNAWAVGGAYNLGTVSIFKTTNGGTTWTPQTSGIPTALYSISAIDANTAWVAGAGGVILKTINGGTTWTSQESETTYSLFSIAAIDTNNAWAVGGEFYPGTVSILKTIDGGTTWTPQTSTTTYSLFSIGALDANNVWIVGEYASILHYHSPANATATKLLVKLPGQSFADGVGVYGTPSAVRAGENANATIYAVDNNNVLDKGNASWAGFTTTDPNDANPAPIQLTQGGTCVQADRYNKFCLSHCRHLDCYYL